MSGEYDYGEVIHAFGENGELSTGAALALNNFMTGTVNPAISAASGGGGGGGGGVTDHGALTGLSDDDHTQYALADGSRGSFATTAQGALADTSVQEGDPRLTNARTPTTHQHSASDINSGTLGIARIPTGTSSSTVALGNHSHTPASVGAAPASHTHGAADLSGVVKTVNGEAPDGAGNVDVTGGGWWVGHTIPVVGREMFTPFAVTPGGGFLLKDIIGPIWFPGGASGWTANLVRFRTTASFASGEGLNIVRWNVDPVTNTPVPEPTVNAVNDDYVVLGSIDLSGVASNVSLSVTFTTPLSIPPEGVWLGLIPNTFSLGASATGRLTTIRTNGPGSGLTGGGQIIANPNAVNMATRGNVNPDLGRLCGPAFELRRSA